MPKTVAALLVLLASGAPVRSATARHLVALAGRDDAGLRQLLVRQQDPASPDYRRWLTVREFGERFGARPHDLRRVDRWLRGSGCRVRRTAGRALVACDGPATLAVPPALADVVLDVASTASAPPVVFRLGHDAAQPRLAVNGRYVVTPSEFQRIYGIGSALGAFPDGNGRTIGVVAVSSVVANDVVAFRSRFALPPIDLVGNVGTPLAGQDAEIEALLDVEWSGAVAPQARIQLAIGQVVADSLGTLVNTDAVDVVTMSVALCPSRTARPFIKMGLRLFKQAAAEGKTVLVASGDSGPRSCAKGGLDPFASSPWVTAVGGTTPSPTLDTNHVATGYGTEVVWDDSSGASGGGTSHVPRPRYQRGSAHRTVPDVAFPADGIYPIGYQGQVQCCIGGTSAAAPTWAGAIAQLDEVLGRRVGFLNERLYALGRAQQKGGPAAFHDVTVGMNGFGTARGFSARPGYDAATGWGSMNGPVFFAGFQ